MPGVCGHPLPALFIPHEAGCFGSGTESRWAWPGAAPPSHLGQRCWGVRPGSRGGWGDPLSPRRAEASASQQGAEVPLSAVGLQATRPHSRGHCPPWPQRLGLGLQHLSPGLQRFRACVVVGFSPPSFGMQTLEDRCRGNRRCPAPQGFPAGTPAQPHEQPDVRTRFLYWETRVLGPPPADPLVLKRVGVDLHVTAAGAAGAQRARSGRTAGSAPPSPRSAKASVRWIQGEGWAAAAWGVRGSGQAGRKDP